MQKMAFSWLLLGVLLSSSEAVNIDLLECEPPDLPVRGSYGPTKEYYNIGDVIHYFCDVNYYIGGNFYRKCEDTGDWSGDTPVCDPATTFKTTFQTSSVDDDSDSEKAVDGKRKTCSETIGGEREEWSGTFNQSGQLIRVMLFLPKGVASFEVVLVKKNGEEVICGKHTTNIDRHDWIVQNCPETRSGGAAGLKIRSLTTKPLRICEIQAHVLTSPKCKDPRYPIEKGRLKITRKTATLVCDAGFKRSPDVKLECVREGQWNRKTLFCVDRLSDGTDDRDYFDGEREPIDDDREPRGPDNEPHREQAGGRSRSF